jgi:transcriptional regulator with XRE-family HTH domain
MIELLKKLDNYRLECKLTQKQLAEKLGVAFVTVNRWLNGHTKPNKIQEYQIRKLLEGEGR